MFSRRNVLTEKRNREQKGRKRGRERGKVGEGAGRDEERDVF